MKNGNFQHYFLIFLFYDEVSLEFKLRNDTFIYNNVFRFLYIHFL